MIQFRCDEIWEEDGLKVVSGIVKVSAIPALLDKTVDAIDDCGCIQVGQFCNAWPMCRTMPDGEMVVCFSARPVKHKCMRRANNSVCRQPTKRT